MQDLRCPAGGFRLGCRHAFPSPDSPLRTFTRAVELTKHRGSKRKVNVAKPASRTAVERHATASMLIVPTTQRSTGPGFGMGYGFP